MSKASLDKMAVVRRCFIGCLWVWLLLAAAARGGLPQRRSRQASEEEGAGNKSPGVWSVWGPWSSCSQSCGLGLMERSRVCIAPAVDNPWDQGADAHSQGARIYSQPSFYSDIHQLPPHMVGRQSYPLHSDQTAEVPPVLPGVLPVMPIHRPAVAFRPLPQDRYEPYSRHLRHQTFGAEEGLSLRNPLNPSRREGSRHDALTNNNPTSSHWAAIRDSSSLFPKRNMSQAVSLPLHRTPAKDSLPLFRLERGELREARPYSYSPEDPQDPAGHHRTAIPPISPSMVTGPAQRPRVQAFIKPGKYGYGRVPFSLSLHKQAEEAERLWRQHQGSSNDAPQPARQQAKPPSGKQKRKAPSVGPEISEAYSKLPQSLLLNTSDSGVKDRKGDVSSPIKDIQRDSPTSQDTDDSGPPEATVHPTRPRPQDRVQAASHGTDQRSPLQRQVDWSIEEVVLHTVGKRNRAKRQLKEQNSTSVGNGQRLLAGDSPEEEGHGIVAKNRKSREELHQSEEFLDAPPGEEAEALRASEGHYSRVLFDVPSSTMRTKPPSANPTAGQAAEAEISALPNNNWVSEKSLVRLSKADSSEKKGTEIFRMPTELPSREASAMNIGLQEGSTLNNTGQAEVWDAMKSEQKKTAVGSTESSMHKSRSIKAKPTDLVYPTEEGQGKQRRQGLSKDTQPRQRQQVVSKDGRRTSLNTQEHRPSSAKLVTQPQVVARRPLKTIKIPSMTNSARPSDEVALRAPHHQTRFLQPYSRSQAQPAVPNQTRAGVRSSQHRQPEYRPGGFGAHPPHSLFRDPPPVQRPLEPNVLLLEGGDDRGQRPNHGLPVGTAPQQWNLYHPGTESYHCDGPPKQHKACSEQPCPSRSPDPRVAQCSTFDNQEFMGRMYKWEPFTEVQGYQRCELNCRPIGYRFYVRHTEKVQDGTPCEAGSTDICVGGQCMSPGCDGILGSNKTLDVCGTCGGDGKACKLVVGTFNDTDVPIGYHKILEIPKGATKINVTEMTRSPNYLALRSRSGKSVINGNWAVDPPGTYLAGSTEFIYTRPGGEDNAGGESFTALGPTTEVLDVYMIFQQDNPGVAYRFFVSSTVAQFTDPVATDPATPAFQLVPRQSGATSWASRRDQYEPVLYPAHPITVVRNVPAVVRDVKPARPVGTLQRNVRVPPLRPPPLNNRADPPEYYWRRVGTTECSVTCGKGFWNPILRCVSRTYHEEVEDSECGVASRPASSPEVCSTQPCPAFWDVGEWAACSKSCGPGMQHRQVLCRQLYANRTTMVHPQRCSQLEKPEVTQACQIHVCSHWEISSNWSACSVMCGLGQRMRYVRCISNHGDVLSDGDCSIRLRPKITEACDMGACVRSWFHDEWSPTCSAECGTGIQKRSVVCLSSEASGESSQTCTGSKPADMKACNGGPCLRTLLWYASPWSQCSAECDDGTQRRDVICVSKLGNEFNVTDPSECRSLEKPSILRPCKLGSCGARWYTTPWSACSRSCLGGLQVREARCLTTERAFSYLCDPDSKPMEKRTCNTHICVPKMDENCKDKHQNCNLVVQARLCAYSYYKMSCCASCSRPTDRTQTPPTQ